MKLLYYRIYYTIKRGLLWLGNDESDSPRFTAILILSLFLFFNFLAAFLFYVVTVKTHFAINRIVGVIIMLGFLAFNWHIINKKNGKELEHNLSKNWENECNKNILITTGYIVLTILLFGLSCYYAQKNPLLNR